jgi:hypothetical protein
VNAAAQKDLVHLVGIEGGAFKATGKDMGRQLDGREVSQGAVELAERGPKRRYDHGLKTRIRIRIRGRG